MSESPAWKYSLADLAAECEREVKQREFVYPGLVERKKLSQATADKRTDMMRELARRLRVTSHRRGETTNEPRLI